MSYERDNIRRMAGYSSGEQPLDPGTAKLNTNENPYPASPRVQAVLDAFTIDGLRRYPPPNADGFRRAAADLHGVAPDNILPTRGGDELLRLVITTFVDPHDTIAMSDPTYSLYPVLSQVQDARTLRIPLNEDWSLPADFAAQANKAGAKLTFVVNPHAPSGRLLDVDAIRRIADELDGLLLLDEAYVDFIEPAAAYNAVPLIEAFDNIVILRSLSKGYSLAGLRFGYGIGPTSLIEPMRTKTRDSYNLDAISQQLAEAAIRDQGWSRETWRKVREQRARLRQDLAELGIETPESAGNFLLATVPEALPPAREIYETLKDQGILVRYFDADRLSDKLRISIGTESENDRLVAALIKLANG